MKRPSSSLYPVLAICACLLASCSKPKAEAEPPTVSSPPAAIELPKAPKFDPIASLEVIVMRLKTNAVAEAKAGLIHNEVVTYDIKKTDSLITPLVGLIWFKQSQKKDGPVPLETYDETEISLAPRNDHWELTGIRTKGKIFLNNEQLKSFSDQGPMKEVGAGTEYWQRIERLLFETPKGP